MYWTLLSLEILLRCYTGLVQGEIPLLSPPRGGPTKTVNNSYGTPFKEFLKGRYETDIVYLTFDLIYPFHFLRKPLLDNTLIPWVRAPCFGLDV